jgi:hypothetical protein
VSARVIEVADVALLGHLACSVEQRPVHVELPFGHLVGSGSLRRTGALLEPLLDARGRQSGTASANVLASSSTPCSYTVRNTEVDVSGVCVSFRLPSVIRASILKRPHVIVGESALPDDRRRRAVFPRVSWLYSSGGYCSPLTSRTHLFLS